MLIDSLKKVAPKGLPIEVSAGRYVAVDVRELKSGEKAVHLINYNKVRLAENIRIGLSQIFEDCTRADLYSPDHEDMQIRKLLLKKVAEKMEVVIPMLNTYVVAVLY